MESFLFTTRYVLVLLATCSFICQNNRPGNREVTFSVFE